MKILVVGSGGREHALVWKLAQSPLVTELACCPGSDAIGGEGCGSGHHFSPVHCVSIPVTRAKIIAEYARKYGYDLVVPGPEACLEAGLGDYCRELGIPFAGPCRRGARVEGSKAYQCQFLQDHAIPSPVGRICWTRKQAHEAAFNFFNHCAVKADGPTLGKGVHICGDEEEVTSAIERLMVRREYGSAGGCVVIQELQIGAEVSLHAIIDKNTALPLESACDYKRAGMGDTGPLTGGMGGYSPGRPILDESFIQTEILDRFMKGCGSEEIIYRGILYPGLMLTMDGPKVLEFNARWGDPEAQLLMRRFQGDLATLLSASATDTLQPDMLAWAPEPAVAIVLASRGYPDTPETGKEIFGLEEVWRMPDVKVFHSGTKFVDGRWLTDGGRVLTVTAVGSNARAKAYKAARAISFEGAWYRQDIATHLS